MSTYLLLRQWTEARLEGKALGWLKEAVREIGEGSSSVRFAGLYARASRFARSTGLELNDKELRAAGQAIEGWSPERWTLRDAVRGALLLSRPDLTEEAGAVVVEDVFRYADVGETIALCRSLALLPEPGRFVGRAREGCRSNMRSVFEATALDTPYPFAHFDDGAWNQLVIKCVFLEAPLWRLYGLDQRLSKELARMALDLVEERRSAGRTVQPELWLALGEHAGKRGLAALSMELAEENPHRDGRRAAALGLARADAHKRLKRALDDEKDELVRETIAAALDGPVTQEAFRVLDQERAS